MFIYLLSTTNLDKRILGKLVGKARLTHTELTKLVKHMTAQLMEQFEKPGAVGATAQWCQKLIALYPQLADEGETSGEKTVK